MNRGKIIVVEGPSNSGKTTTCQGMKKYANCVVIDECMIYEPKPPRPSENYEQELANQLFFFEVERRRMKKATRLALEGKNVILDRCALSTVAISYAFERLGKYRTFGHAMREYEKMLHDPTLLTPDGYIFLYTDEDNIIQRNKTRTKELSKHWVDITFTELAKEFSARDSNLGDYKTKLKEYFSKYAKTAGKALEIGPGTGLLLQTLEELGYRTTAIELSEKMCEFARNNSPNTVILNQDIFTVEFFSEQFDIVCALAMIHTIPYEDAKVLLKKVQTCLKKGGFFILDTVRYDESKEIFLPSGNNKNVTKFRKQYTQDELKELICSSGFKIDDISLNLDESNSKVWMRFACQK